MRQETTHIPTAEKNEGEGTEKKIEDRFNFWFSVVDEADISQETKDKVKECLSVYKEETHASQEGHTRNSLKALEHFYSYYAHGELPGAMYEEKNQKEANALRIELQRDMEAFIEELKS